jgi:hypothetical protein
MPDPDAREQRKKPTRLAVFQVHREDLQQEVLLLGHDECPRERTQRLQREAVEEISGNISRAIFHGPLVGIDGAATLLLFVLWGAHDGFSNKTH